MTLFDIAFIIIISVTFDMIGTSESIGKTIDDAVCRGTKGKDVAVAFSGGLDSGLIAALTKKYASGTMLYTAGMLKDGGETDDMHYWSHDAIAAKETAAYLEMEWTHICITESDIEKIIEEMMRITGTMDPLTIAFELPLFFVCSNCKENTVIGGQGADEVFGGYSKYVDLDVGSFVEMRKEDLRRLNESTLLHERKVAEHFGKEILYPFLDQELLKIVDGMGAEAIIPRESGRKMVLRNVVKEMGYDFIADKEKKAAQYGSGVMYLIRRICKRKGMTYGELIDDLSKKIQSDGI